MIARSALLLLVVSLISCIQAEDIVIGSRVSHDQYLGRSWVGSQEHRPLTVAVDEYMFMNPNNGNAKISQLKIKNKGDKCGVAVPINGGPGSNFVIVHFIAPPNCLVDIEVELYGY